MTEAKVQYITNPPKFARFLGEYAGYELGSSTEKIHEDFQARYGYDCKEIVNAGPYLAAGPIKEEGK